ncbi:FixH family protein [Streptomyces rugosispiralis]|uniref:FixH family protein n=1 Tax=Streptomyces rugosispiralis TaxID=2967341 RepID=A0ABT1URM4_9ACTN|nr:FixH family protein [Streptomyces rugosispiralis]MCQ8187767.1 FixH family protein [Streptomyces rugosispiralis]
MSARIASRTPMARFLYGVAAALLTVSLALVAVGFLPSRTDDAVSLTAGSATDEVTLTVARPRTGATDVAIRLTPRRGERSGRPPTVTLQAVMPTHGHATPAAHAQVRSPGSYSTAVHLMMPGRWTFHVSVDHGTRRDQFDFPVAISG